MDAFVGRHALVTVMHINSFRQVVLDRFQVEQRFMPVCVDKGAIYSTETHREGFSVKDLMRSEPIDVATWLHRSGLWDTMPREA